MNKNSNAVMRAQRRKKQHAVDMFGGKCSLCGYKKSLAALEFHHIDKNTKEEKPSYVIMRWSWERAKKELEKCILVCSNCHKEIHEKEKEGFDVSLQKYIKPWITKECPNCNEEFDTKNETQIYCKNSCYHVANRKVKRPDKEELSKLIENKTSWTQMGRMYGVSDNGIRKWAKKYNLI